MFAFLIQLIYDIFYPILDGIRADLIGYSLSFQFCSSSFFVAISLPYKKFPNLLLPLLLVPIPQNYPHPILIPTLSKSLQSALMRTIFLGGHNLLGCTLRVEAKLVI